MTHTSEKKKRSRKESMIAPGPFQVSTILTGGDGLEPRLGETLAEQCKMPVLLDDDRQTLAGLGAGLGAAMHREPGPLATWAVPAGLSLRGLSQGRLARIQISTPRQEAA